MTWLGKLWCRLKIWDLKQPCSLVWVSTHCNVRLVFHTSWHILFHIGIVSVGRWLNLWRKPNSLIWWGINCEKHLLTTIGRCSNYLCIQIARCLSSSFIWHNEWSGNRAIDGLILIRSAKALILHWHNCVSVIIVVIALKSGCSSPQRRV